MLSIRLKSARKSKKLTQEDLAKKVNTTKATISNYENDYSTPSNEMLLLLANALEVSTDYLLGRDEIENNSSDNTAEFESWLNDPRVSKFYKEFNESPEERREALLAVWEILKKKSN